MSCFKSKALLVALLVVSAALARGQSSGAGGAADQGEELAKKLANPVANLISVPLQYNFDENIGPEGDGSKSVLNIQPVAPFALNEDWNLITRTIIPLIDQHDLPVKGQDESGLGDVLASQFFSPKSPTAGGWIWGVGPVELLPTASDDTLGGQKLGLGPTLVVLRQDGPVTIGFLGNQVWSVAGDDDRSNISSTFAQPFVSYITKTKTTLGLNTESTYDWQTEQWSVPINASAAQLLKIGSQIIQVTVGARYWAESPDNGPEDWGLRLVLTFLFPK